MNTILEERNENLLFFAVSLVAAIVLAMSAGEIVEGGGFTLACAVVGWITTPFFGWYAFRFKMDDLLTFKKKAVFSGVYSLAFFSMALFALGNRVTGLLCAFAALGVFVAGLISESREPLHD